MKKLSQIFVVVFSILVLSHGHLFSQTKWAAGISYSPSLNYALSPDWLPEPKGQAGYGLGITADYFLSDRFLLESGISYKIAKLLWSKGWAPDTRWAWDDMNGNGVLDFNDRLNPDNIAMGDLYEQYKMFSIPITINYKSTDKFTSSLITSLGVELNYIYILQNTGNTAAGINKIYHEENVSYFSSSVSIGIAFFQPLGSNFFIIAGPGYSYDLFSNINSFKTKYHSLRLNIKLEYSFN